LKIYNIFLEKDSKKGSNSG